MEPARLSKWKRNAPLERFNEMEEKRKTLKPYNLEHFLEEPKGYDLMILGNDISDFCPDEDENDFAWADDGEVWQVTVLDDGTAITAVAIKGLGAIFGNDIQVRKEKTSDTIGDF